MKLRTSTSRVALAAITTSLLVAACGDKVLDYRNAEINNGKVYSGESDTPFSGQVTNVPFNVVLMSQPGFSKAMQAFNTTVKTPVPDLYNVALCDVHVRDGALDGKTVCKPPQSGIVRAEASFSAGELTGSLTINDEDGNTALTSVSFADGQPDGKQEMHKPGNHKLVHTVHWSKGALDGEEEGFDEETGHRTLDANWSDGQHDGKYIEYAPDGKQVVDQVNFVHGAKDGIEKLFYPDTGKPRQYGQYVEGRLTGTAKAWDPDGRLVYERDYVNGNKVPDSPELSACIEHMINDVKAASDYTIGREDVARAYCRENPNASADTAPQAAVPASAPELAQLTSPAASATPQQGN